MFTIKEILVATKGQLIQGVSSLKMDGVSINSRQIKRSQLFIAIKGERFDGHNFISQVIQKGIRAVIVSKRGYYPQHISVILVKDTTKALGNLAADYRNRFKIPIIAVTGSAGKTTTKEMIADVLGERYKILKNFETENNHFGVPLTLLKLNASHRAAVLELGTNQFGDIPYLASIVKPTICVFTNIGESHLEQLKSSAGVFKEKIQMVNHMNGRGVVVYNNDDDFLRKISTKKSLLKKISYSIDKKADLVAKDIHCIKNKIQFKVKQKKFFLNTPGRHHIYNALAAIACGALCKVKYNQIKKALSHFQFPEGRQKILNVNTPIVCSIQ